MALQVDFCHPFFLWWIKITNRILINVDGKQYVKEESALKDAFLCSKICHDCDCTSARMK